MNRYLPASIFIVVLMIGLGMTSVLYRAEQTTAASRFELVADDAADRVLESVNQHISLLRATTSFFAAQRTEVNHEAFATFIEGLDLSDRLAGVQGIGFARRIATGDEAGIAAELRANYEIDRSVTPESTNQQTRTPIVLLEPNDRNNNLALGYDMYSEPTRRAAMIGSMAVNDAYASSPVELGPEAASEEQPGFLVYVPVHKPDADPTPETVIGFVYARLRAADLHTAALRRSPPLQVVVETADITNGGSHLLYQSPDFDAIAPSSAYRMTRNLNVVGRQWQMTIVATPGFGGTSPSLVIYVVGAISLVLAAALAASTQAQLRALDAAQQMHASFEKGLNEKDLMLQEMKHRIKNSIARVLAIARQTAVHSTSIEEFAESYTARLQAMAGAQDMLTRSHWQRADLRELLATELEQVFGSEAASYELSGDVVELNERAAQSLGLVFHELATNALKYGGMAEEGGSLRVSWKIVRAGKIDSLKIDWTENSVAPVKEPGTTGFGTRLIDANVRGELGGTVERKFAATGVIIRLNVPMQNCI